MSSRTRIPLESDARALVDSKTVVLVDDGAILNRDIVTADIEPVRIFPERRARG